LCVSGGSVQVPCLNRVPYMDSARIAAAWLPCGHQSFLSICMNIASLEDDADQTELIRHILAEAGHDCSSFATGKALLDALRTHPPFDLMLIDWEIPDIAGIEVVRWIRTHLGYEVPLMFVTGRTLEKDLVAGLQAG